MAAFFKKAEPRQGFARIGLYGWTGSGKTLTSLLCAEGLAKITGKRVAFINADKGPDFYLQHIPERTVHPQPFDIDIVHTKSVTDAADAVKSFDPKSYCCCVLDNISALWESTMAAYSGPRPGGEIPAWAWDKLKMPYKTMFSGLFSLPAHVIVTGRQGNEFGANEETGKMEFKGFKMKAEGQTAYEFQVLIHMEAVRHGEGRGEIQAFVENDTCGVLGRGNIIGNPGFPTIMQPLLKYLNCATQPPLVTEYQSGAIDSHRINEMESSRMKQSAALVTAYSARIDLAKTADELKAIGKELTPELKSTMLPADVNKLREKYLASDAHKVSSTLTAEQFVGEIIADAKTPQQIAAAVPGLTTGEKIANPLPDGEKPKRGRPKATAAGSNPGEQPLPGVSPDPKPAAAATSGSTPNAPAPSSPATQTSEPATSNTGGSTTQVLDMSSSQDEQITDVEGHEPLFKDDPAPAAPAAEKPETGESKTPAALDHSPYLKYVDAGNDLVEGEVNDDDFNDYIMFLATKFGFYAQDKAVELCQKRRATSFTTPDRVGNFARRRAQLIAGVVLGRLTPAGQVFPAITPEELKLLGLPMK